MDDMSARIRQLLDPILESLGLSFWNLELQKHGPQWLLRIYIDREDSGATLDDCEAVSRDLSTILDVEDIIPHAYTLEVSSPGLDRALTRPEHFVRFSGSAIKVKTYQQIEGQKVFHGKLLELVGDIVRIELETGMIMEIPTSAIAKTSLEVKF
jgi:ribosome maturation factor RimP